MIKKEVIIIFFLIVLALPLIKSDEITGHATSQQTTISIFVSASAPSLVLHNPVNNSNYLSNESLLLNFSVSGHQATWYNLDNGVNRTVTGFTYFNTTIGNHTLYFFANNSDGIVVGTTSLFTTNITKFDVIYGNYQNHGSTTQFDIYSYEQIQSITNAIIEMPSFGKISYGDTAINLTDTANITSINIDQFINISSNHIFMNSSQVHGLNRSAKLYLYSLTFSDPRILIDGEVCPSSICTKESYSGGTLVFNVTHFTTYSAEETPGGGSGGTGGNGGAGGGGGSGGGAGSAKSDISVSPEQLTIQIKQGEVKTQKITIKNKGSSTTKITLSPEKIEDLVKIKEESFDLKPGESKSVELSFIATEQTPPALYLGKIKVKSSTSEQEIIVAITVNSKKALFDVMVEIPKRYSIIKAGEDIAANIRLIEVEPVGVVDVELYYVIADENGQAIIKDKETISVSKQSAFVKSIRIPEETPMGRYLFYVEANYQGQVARASGWFIVGSYSLNKIMIYVIVGMILLIIILIVVFAKVLRKPPIRKSPTLTKFYKK